MIDRLVASLDPELIRKRRWFRHRTARKVTFLPAGGWLAGNPAIPEAAWLFVLVDSGDDDAIYQMPVALRSGPRGPGALGEIVLDRPYTLCDAPDTPSLLAELFNGKHAMVESFAASPPDVAGARTLEIDSTNTLLRTRNALAKIYRCLDPASGREAEILEGLAKLGTGGLPTVQALVRANELPSRPAIMLIQDWVPNADPAWEHFTAVLASGPDVDLSNEIRATAEATAAVHHGLAQLGSRPWEEADTQALRSRILRQIDGLMTSELPNDVQPLLDEARRLASDITPGAGGIASRVHGDLHLGQMLMSAGTCVVLDFEGEPLAAPEERSAWHSPLKDVAGMLRSIDYAAGFARKNGAPGDEASWRSWSERAQEHFLRCYGRSGAHLGDESLRYLYLLEKTTYEITYEMKARPDWLEIPFHGLRAVLAACTR